MGFPDGAGSKEPICQCRRHRLDPWVGKISWTRAWQCTPVFLPGDFHGQKSLAGYSSWDLKESDVAELLSVHVCMHAHTHTHTHTE